MEHTILVQKIKTVDGVDLPAVTEAVFFVGESLVLDTKIPVDDQDQQIMDGQININIIDAALYLRPAAKISRTIHRAKRYCFDAAMMQMQFPVANQRLEVVHSWQ